MIVAYVQVLVVCIFLVDSLLAVDCSLRPKHATVTKCCALNGHLQAIQDKCETQYPADQHQKQFCFGECVFNETGLAVNHEIRTDKIRAAIAEIYKSTPDVIPKANPITTYCIGYAKELAADIKARAAAGDCNPEFGVLLSCLAMGTFEFCPTNAWMNTEECNKAKEFANACNKRKNQ